MSAHNDTALSVLDAEIASIERIIGIHEARIAVRKSVGTKDDEWTVELNKRDVRVLRIVRRKIVEALGASRPPSPEEVNDPASRPPDLNRDTMPARAPGNPFPAGRKAGSGG